MYERVNPSHPDKVADRIAGAIVDLAYQKSNNPKIAVECMIGHGHCSIIIESSETITREEVDRIIRRIAGKDIITKYVLVPQDHILAQNQEHGVRCGDNGVFKGMPMTWEECELSQIARHIYGMYPTDGKYILDENKLVICQSHASTEALKQMYPDAIINPLGFWLGSIDVDTGCVNRKLGSDMGQSVTGSGLHGKDLSKADVSVNIYCWLKAQDTGEPVEISCAIGDDTVDGIPYSEIVKIARDYIDSIGGFEKFAEWGLIR